MSNRKKAKRSVICLAASILLLLSACTGQEAPEEVPGITHRGSETKPTPDPHLPGWFRMDNPGGDNSLTNTGRNIPEDLFCPEYESPDAAEAIRNVVIDQNRTGPVLAMGGGATIRVMPGITVSGDVTICGRGAQLILQGAVTGRVLIRGGGAALILTDGVSAPAATWLYGGGPQVIPCVEGGSAESSCSRYF